MSSPEVTSPEPSVAIITAACGDSHLQRCIASVRRQSYRRLRHYIVADGATRAPRVQEMIRRGHDRLTLLVLPEETGADGYNGHRIYGCIPSIVNADYVAFLDEDNEFTPNHIESLVVLAESAKLDWAYSLRCIIDHAGRLICRDDCDSLGIWGSWYGVQHHIDANCYLMKRTVAVEVSGLWHRKGYSTQCVDPDKAICRWLLANRIRGFTTGEYSVRYRIGSTSLSAKANYFKEGNAVMRTIFRYFPWRRPMLEIIDERIDYRRIVARHDPYRSEIIARLQRQENR